MFDIKHQPDAVLVDQIQFWLMFDEKCFFFHTSENDIVQSKILLNFIFFLESTYPKMQRKHIPRVHEYQS